MYKNKNKRRILGRFFRKIEKIFKNIILFAKLETNVETADF